MHYIIDTCVWVSYFNKNDSLHNQAKKIISKVLNENQSEIVKNIFITSDVVLETVTVLMNRINKLTAKNFIIFLNNCSQINIQTLNFWDSLEMAMKWFVEQDGSLSLADLSLVAIAINHDIELITFDKKLENFYKNKKFSF